MTLDATPAADPTLGAGPRPKLEDGRLTRSIHSGRVVAQLREEIIAGTLEAGAPLRESALAERLEVSRGPVRNALLELQGEGLVETHRNGRSYSAGFTQNDLRDLLDVRLEHESLAIRRGIERGVEPTGIVEAFERMRGEAASTPQLIDLDMAFHRAIVEFSGNRMLVRAWLVLAPVVRAVITVGNRRLGIVQPVEDFDRILGAHAPIVEAITTGQPEVAAGLLADQFAVTSSMYRIDDQQGASS
jgi:GntR family transcriptional regulator of gluconate operon